jgi:formylglycine-generating enzyme required for sulfatase activity
MGRNLLQPILRTILVIFFVVGCGAPAATQVSEAPIATAPPPGATRVREADGMVMVYVPAGEFLMGETQEQVETALKHCLAIYDTDNICCPSCLRSFCPQHRVYLDAFWIDRTEVTNRQFEKFAQATDYRTKIEQAGAGQVWTGSYLDFRYVKRADWRHPEGPDSNIAGRMDVPVVQVSWNDAQAYCRWAGGQLPTEAQWEKAACGTDGRSYPWGNQEPSCQYAVMHDQGGNGCGQGENPMAVGSKPQGASPYGALDMAGNVWEWLADRYAEDYYTRSPASNPQGPDKGDEITSRGGSWVDAIGSGGEDILRCAYRGSGLPVKTTNIDGFRCAMTVSLPKGPAGTATPPNTPAP